MGTCAFHGNKTLNLNRKKKGGIKMPHIQDWTNNIDKMERGEALVRLTQLQELLGWEMFANAFHRKSLELICSLLKLRVKNEEVVIYSLKTTQGE
jgi:hypothetical protein